MPQLKKSFEGYSTGRLPDYPLERSYAVNFQEFVRGQYPAIFIKGSKPRSTKDELRTIAPLLIRMLFGIHPEYSGIRDWKLVCSVVQWLGSYEGQAFLKQVKECRKDDRKIRHGPRST